MTARTARLTASEETFCRIMATGASSVTAARVAGIRPDLAATIGTALCGRDDIQVRIGVLFAEREAEHAARLQRMIERLDQIHEAALEKGQLGVAYKAITQVSRLIDGETRRLQRGFEELRLPAFPAGVPVDFPVDFLPEPPPASRPAPKARTARPNTVAPLSDADLLPAGMRRIMEAELGLTPAEPRPAGLPLTVAGPRSADGSRSDPPGARRRP